MGSAAGGGLLSTERSAYMESSHVPTRKDPMNITAAAIIAVIVLLILLVLALTALCRALDNLSRRD